MNRLTKYAALATIIGTVFTIYVYYYDGTTIPIAGSVKENVKNSQSKQTTQIEDKEKSYCESLIKEIEPLPSAGLSELRVRHKAAKEIPSSTEESKALFDVVKICLRNQQFDYASDVAIDIPSSTTQSEAYRAISILLAYKGQFENAIKTAKKIPSSTTQSIALKEIATIKKRSLGSDFGIDILTILALPAIFLSWLENPA